MRSRVAIVVIVAAVTPIIAGCGGSASLTPSTTVTPTYVKDQAKPTVAGRLPPTGAATPSSEPPDQPLAFDFIDAEHGWLAFGGEETTTLLATADGGRTWSPLLALEGPVDSLDFVSLDKGWMTTEGRLLTSNDGGQSWAILEAKDFQSGTEVTFIDSDRGWAIWNEGNADFQVSSTADGGTSWVPVAMPCRWAFTASISFVDQAIGWIACGGQPATAMSPKELYRTHDGGQSWQAVSCACFEEDSPNVPGTMPWSGHLTGAFFVDESNGWMTTARGGLAITSDGGVSWRSIPTGVGCGDEFISHPRVLSPSLGYVIAGCGIERLLTTLDGGVTWSSLYPPPFLESCSTPELRARPRFTSLCSNESSR